MTESEEFCKNFTVFYNEELSVPIFESERGDWIGIGHFEPDTFLDTVWDINIELGNVFEGDFREHFALLPDVHHLWATIVSFDELLLHWADVTEDTPGSIPITVLYI